MKVIKAGDFIEVTKELHNSMERCFPTIGQRFLVRQDSMGFSVQCDWGVDSNHRIAGEGGMLWDQELMVIPSEQENESH